MILEIEIEGGKDADATMIRAVGLTNQHVTAVVKWSTRKVSEL